MLHLAQNWHDYELIDSGNGEKLERWGEIIIIRPETQAIWPRQAPQKWKNPHMRYHRSKKGGGTWEEIKPPPKRWVINYENLRFNIKPTDFKHMGLFPEQAVNWQWTRDIITSAHNSNSQNLNSQNQNPPLKILNLFAYTGGATAAALSAGANVTHIDAAKGMNEWARENIILSNLADKPHRVLTDDVMKFVAREQRRGNQYDGIIMDPPAFGRGPNGELWKLEEKLYELISACTQILSPAPKFVLINGYTAGLSPATYANILTLLMQKSGYKGDTTFGEIGLPSAAGIPLPCGVFVRWVGAHSTK